MAEGVPRNGRNGASDRVAVGHQEFSPRMAQSIRSPSCLLISMLNARDRTHATSCLMISMLESVLPTEEMAQARSASIPYALVELTLRSGSSGTVTPLTLRRDVVLHVLRNGTI